MYNDIGSKIKSLEKTMLIFAAICSKKKNLINFNRLTNFDNQVEKRKRLLRRFRFFYPN